MAFISSLSIITTRSAARGCGNPHRWSKQARPPPTQPTIHLTSHHTFHIRSVDFYIAPNPHQHLLTIPLLTLTMDMPHHQVNRHVMESHSHNASLHHHVMSSILQLKGVGCTGMAQGFMLMLMMIFQPLFSFSLFQAIKPPVVILLGCGASLANVLL